VKRIDSSGWLELPSDGPLASAYEEHVGDPEEAAVPHGGNTPQPQDSLNLVL
jgi:hypothetical protein